MARTRTNIEIDDDDVVAAMRRFGVHTKTEAVAAALRSVAVTPLSDREYLAMRGAQAIEDDVADSGPVPGQR